MAFFVLVSWNQMIVADCALPVVSSLPGSAFLVSQLWSGWTFERETLIAFFSLA
jgi:hypothetical protein